MLRDLQVLSQPSVRFAIASIIALSIDLCVVLFLNNGMKLSLTVSSAIAFVFVGIVFYFVHEYWTFQRINSVFSPVRLMQNFCSLILGFTARVGIIALLETYLPAGFFLNIIYFGAGVAASFSVNYLLNKNWVFATKNV